MGIKNRTRSRCAWEKLTIIKVLATARLEGELCDGDGRQGGASVGVTLETAVAAAISARIRAWVRREITVATTPNATSLPVVRDSEGDSLARRLLPSRSLVGDGSADVQVGEELSVLHQ